MGDVAVELGMPFRVEDGAEDAELGYKNLLFRTARRSLPFIYLFTESGGTSWVMRLVSPFAQGLFSWSGKLPAQIIASLAAWSILWSRCYWPYKRRILIKI